MAKSSLSVQYTKITWNLTILRILTKVRLIFLTIVRKLYLSELIFFSRVFAQFLLSFNNFSKFNATCTAWQRVQLNCILLLSLKLLRFKCATNVLLKNYDDATWVPETNPHISASSLIFFFSKKMLKFWL